MRAILDVHPDISCGPETKVIPAIIRFISDYLSAINTIKDLDGSGIKIKTINSALGLFIHHILENHIRSAERLCAKDPDILYYMEYLHEIFPKAKFIYMVRDGRDVAWSMIKQVKGESTLANFLRYLDTWSSFNQFISEQCTKIGVESCLNVRYEDLVLDPKHTLIKIAQFLGIEWTDDFLKHEKFIGSKIAVSDLEWSTDQIKNPIYKDSINKWFGKIVGYDRSYVNHTGSMLIKFGYDVKL